MQIASSAAVLWIMTKLYQKNNFMDEDDLFDNLCNTAFAELNSADDFARIIDQLRRAKFIEKLEGYAPTNYKIAREGKLQFKKQIEFPLKEIKENKELEENILNSPAGKEIHEKALYIVKSIKKTSDVSDMSATIIKLCLTYAKDISTLLQGVQIS